MSDRAFKNWTLLCFVLWALGQWLEAINHMIQLLQAYGWMAKP